MTAETARTQNIKAFSPQEIWLERKAQTLVGLKNEIGRWEKIITSMGHRENGLHNYTDHVQKVRTQVAHLEGLEDSITESYPVFYESWPNIHTESIYNALPFLENMRFSKNDEDKLALLAEARKECPKILFGLILDLGLNSPILLTGDDSHEQLYQFGLEHFKYSLVRIISGFVIADGEKPAVQINEPSALVPSWTKRDGRQGTASLVIQTLDVTRNNSPVASEYSILGADCKTVIKIIE